jgi:hypothetical protein
MGMNEERLLNKKRKGPKPFNWTKEETALLEKLAATTRVCELAKILGRSKHSIVGKKRLMKMGGISPRHWTDEQIEMLRTAPRGTTTAELARRIGKTYPAVRHMAMRLKVALPTKPEWSAAEILALRACEGMSVEAVMAVTGRSARGVEGKARQLSIQLTGYQKRRMPAGRILSKPKPPRREVVIASQIEYCPRCHAPVSNWHQHFERTGHRRPVAEVA